MFRKTWEALAGAVVFAGSLVGATSAQAADLGGAGYGSTKDAGPAMDRPHIGNWSGIYVGVNAGVSWENYSSDYRRFADLTANPDAPKYSSSETKGRGRVTRRSAMIGMGRIALPEWAVPTTAARPA